MRRFSRDCPRPRGSPAQSQSLSRWSSPVWGEKQFATFSRGLAGPLASGGGGGG